MSVSQNNSVPPDDWLPDWFRAWMAVPAPREDEAAQALGPHGVVTPDPPVVQGAIAIQPAGAQSAVDSEYCVHVRSAEEIPLDPLDRNGVAIQPPAMAHAPINDGNGFIPIEPAGEFLVHDGIPIQPAGGTININIDPERDRSVKRRLRGIHIFAITISGTLGIGLYVQGGQILRLAGPLAVLLSFALLGLLAWAVMQCIAELVCIWPISGALTVFVSEFVDEELGIAVGVAYWITYSVSFAALVAGAAAEAAYWGTPKGIEAGVLFFLIPLILVVINALGIEAYGFTEVISSTFKMCFLIIVIVVMGCINGGAGVGDKIGTLDWSTDIIVFDDAVVDHWVGGFFLSLSIAAFAYIGVEIPAASALEARVPVGRDQRQSRVVGRTVQFTTIWGSVFAGAFYVLAGILVSLNIKWDDPRLPRMPWVVANTTTPLATNSTSSPDSAFIIVAVGSAIPGLAGSLNIFLLFTALSCANTQLYIASRTLFALTRGLSGLPNQPFYLRWLAFFGRTNRRKVPMRALMASCVFAWVPYLYLDPSNGNGTSIGSILNVLSQVGSGVVIVWACECWAFLRFYYCVHEESDHLRRVAMVRRWNPGKNDLPDDYPYRSHGQPLTAYIAITGCLFILIVASGASLWKQWDTNAFLSAYLAPICFIILWVVLKIMKNASWRLVDLSNERDVATKMRTLHEIRFRSAERDENIERSLWNFWGLV